MLVLSRKSGEQLLIGDNIQISIVRIGPNKVRLGIDAPRELKVIRKELVVRDCVAATEQHEGPLEDGAGFGQR